MLIYIAGSKKGFRDDFGQYGAKAIILRPFLAFFRQTPLGYNVAMATPRIPGDQKLFEMMCYI